MMIVESDRLWLKDRRQKGARLGKVVVSGLCSTGKVLYRYRRGVRTCLFHIEYLDM